MTRNGKRLLAKRLHTHHREFMKARKAMSVAYLDLVVVKNALDHGDVENPYLRPVVEKMTKELVALESELFDLTGDLENLALEIEKDGLKR